MRWTPGDRGHIEDRRGHSVRRGIVPMGIGGVLVLLVLSWFTGIDFLSLVGSGGPPPTETVGTAGGPVAASPEEEKTVLMVDAVMQEQGKVELDPDDLEEGLRAAAAIGDDTIQKRSTGRVMPDKFTHGSAAQRVEWFRRGFSTGDPNACDTFGQ